MIPKIIHRLWINPPGPPMPDEFIEYGDSWKRIQWSQGWVIQDWTSLSGIEPLHNQHLYDQASGRDMHRYRSDIVRLELLLKFGGVYVDCDLEPLKVIDDLLTGHECVLAESANRRSNGGAIVSNSFMAAIPGHPFIRQLVESLEESTTKYKGKHTALVTGPYHVQRLLDEYQGDGIHILEPWVFYPQSIADRNAGKPLDLSRAYGWHRWATSRRKFHGESSAATV
ncbi:MAG: glycosyltransferase [Bacilli bacterium]